MSLVSPAPTQPSIAVKQALKMFEDELHADYIDLEFALEASYNHFGIDWVMVNPARLGQILINLMTNARFI